MKDIIFMPFINDNDGKNWRSDIEKRFISGEGADLTAAINEIRNNKPAYVASNELQVYYQNLHEQKSKRQKMWVKYLISETARVFGFKLDDVKHNNANADAATVVCALPEFFWCDINDNDKHISDIDGYHKPLYLETARDILTEDNELMRLTKDHPNMIFFAGTAMWKVINPEDHKDEEIFNSLIVYADGKYKESITKHYVSNIDGFYYGGYDNLVKDKIGESTFNAEPVTEFNGLKFTYDICLDFICGNVLGSKCPLSTELCNKAGINDIDVNVLIAAGMPVDNQKIAPIMSKVLLRCDGLSAPCGEVVNMSSNIRTVSVDVNPLSIYLK